MILRVRVRRNIKALSYRNCKDEANVWMRGGQW
jgi:hypothetical protein